MTIKYRLLILSVLTVLAGFLTAFSQPSEDEKEMKILKEMDYVKPGPNHEILYKFAGKWKQNGYIVSPGDDIYIKGMSINTVIFDGRFVEMKSDQDVIDNPMHTLTHMGYDNFRKKYFLYNIDQLSTQALFLYGDYDKTKKQFTFTGTNYEPETKKIFNIKIVIYFERDDKYVYQVFTIDGKKERKRFESIFVKVNEE